MMSLQQRVAEFDSTRFQSLGPGYVALNIAGEAGELANLVKKLWRTQPNIAQHEGYANVPPEARVRIADEIADVVMLSLVMANHLNIDVEAEVLRKLELIDQRLTSGYYGAEALPSPTTS